MSNVGKFTDDGVIEITVRSPGIGVGKTTVSGLIEHLLKKFNYEVTVVTVPYPGVPPQHYEKEERRRMEEAAGALFDRPSFSYPKGKIKLVVHG